MITKEEYEKQWRRFSTKQRKFVFAYLETFDPKESARRAGYCKKFINSPVYRILRKVGPVIDYLIEKNSIIQNICKPEWIMRRMDETL